MRIRLDEHDERLHDGNRNDLLVIEVEHDNDQNIAVRFEGISPDDDLDSGILQRTLTQNEARALGVLLITAADVALET